MESVDAATLARRRRGMVAGPRWLYGSPDGQLYFTIVAGPIDEPSLRPLLELWKLELGTGGHASLCDASGLSSFAPDAFARLRAFLDEHRGALARSVQRQALVLPTGMPGTVVAGYYRVFPPPYPFSLCADREAALRSLGYPADTLAAATQTTVGDPLLRALRAMLAQNPRPEVDAIARALGVSLRTLQRRLGQAGTSFRDEVRRAQIALAMELLRTTDQKLAAIAATVGCASAASFGELFTREVGTTPTAWRAAARAAKA